MEARAELRQVRISPRKVGIVLDLIRNKPVEIAFATLKNTPKSACEPLENNHNMDTSRLYVSEAFVGAGVTLKRIRPKDHGRAHRILKRTSNIVLVVKEAE